MIDTDKYERMDLEGLTKQDLIEILKGSDPCVLLAEVKRLREENDYLRNKIDKAHDIFQLWMDLESDEK
tara:strand:+ start:513 stop:719 length:207 start_codon:yes stop_codon:yes gene_type:complete